MSSVNFDLIKFPVISEKASIISKDNQVVFRVRNHATKKQVKAVIEDYFDVKVASVNILNTKGKEKRRGNNVGRRKNFKKAYVTLKQNYHIDFSG